MQLAPVPHWQVPEVEHASAVLGSQATQVPPPVPQALTIGDRQRPAEQHPFGQDEALQMQAPFRQAVPAGQAAVVPHRHAPVSVSHPSASVGLQVVQLRPPMPQVASDWAVHTPAAQHPVGQDVAVQAQTPATQFVPAPHAALAPHRHSPDMEQLSARVTSQVTQAAPPAPHAAVPPVVHVDPEQHPLAQLVAVQLAQAPPEQPIPRQSSQAEPPLPQLVSVVPGKHAPAEQQPLGQDVASHTHAPPTQRCPTPHGSAVPH